MTDQVKKDLTGKPRREAKHETNALIYIQKTGGRNYEK